MKKTILTSPVFLFLIFISCFNNTYSQNKTLPNSFVIQGKFSDEVLNFYTKSIEAADFEQYRLKEETVTLKFKNGFLHELLSAKDLTVKNKMQNLDFNKYPAKVNVPNYKYPVFEILKSGMITGEVNSESSK